MNAWIQSVLGDSLRCTAYGSMFAAAAVGILVATRHPRHWSVVACLAGNIVASVIFGVVNDGKEHGWLRAFYLLGPCSIAALSLHTLGKTKVWPALLAWIVLSGAGWDVVRVPDPTGIQRAAALSVLAAGFAALLARIPCYVSTDDANDDMRLDVAAMCAIALIAQWGPGDFVAAYISDQPWDQWRFVQRLAIFVSVVLIALQGGWLWRQRTRSSVAR